MTSETTVTIARHDKTQDLDIIIPTLVVPRKLMQKYKTLIDCSRVSTFLNSTYSNMQVGLFCF